MTLNRGLLTMLLHENPFQPATCLWRAVEVGFVAQRSLPMGRGIDIGCGDGRLMAVLLSLVGDGDRNLVGIDVDNREVEGARATGIYSEVHATAADLIPEPDGSFDWAFSNSTLEHIEPIERTLNEVSRLLRTGGRFIFTVPSHEFHDCMRGPLAGSRQRYLASLDKRCAHLRYWDEERWQSECERVGMRLVTVEGYLSIAESRRWELISALTAGILHRLAKKSPIQIQRTFGMRSGQRMPMWAARILARILALGLGNDDRHPQGCRYIVAERVAV